MGLKTALLACVLALSCSAAAMAEPKTFTSTVMNASSSPSTAALQFKGLNCIKDCITQKRGYDWAVRNNVEDIDGCKPLNLQPARDGCAVYVRERQAAQPPIPPESGAAQQ